MKKQKINLLFTAIILFFCINVLIVNNLQAQIPSVIASKCFGGSKTEYAGDVIKTSDGGYALIGTTGSNNGNVSGNHSTTTFDFWVVKLLPSGSIQWQKCLGGTGYDYGEAIRQTADGGFIVAGRTGSIDGDVTGYHGVADGWVVKLNSAGVIQWQRACGGSDFDRFYDVIQTPDGGYIALGETSVLSNNTGDVSGVHGTDPNSKDIWAVKLNSAGVLQWQKCLGGTASDYGFGIQKTTDGGSIIVGLSASNDGDVTGNHGGGADVWVVKLNSAGTIQWQKCLGGSALDYGYHIIQATDGNYVLTGMSNSNDGDVSGNHGGFDMWVAKISSTGSGSLIWQKSYGGTGYEVGNKVIQTADGGYAIWGNADVNSGDVTGNHGDSDGWLVRINSTNTLQWQLSLGGSLADYGEGLALDTDGAYIVTSLTGSTDGNIVGNHGNGDIWGAKVK